MSSIFDKFMAESKAIALDDETSITIVPLPFKIFGKVIKLYEDDNSEEAFQMLLFETLKRSPELKEVSEDQIKKIIDGVRIGILVKIIEAVNEINGLDEKLKEKGIKKN